MIVGSKVFEIKFVIFSPKKSLPNWHKNAIILALWMITSLPPKHNANKPPLGALVPKTLFFLMTPHYKRSEFFFDFHSIRDQAQLFCSICSEITSKNDISMEITDLQAKMILVI